MKVGLIRHFKVVSDPLSGWRTAEELHRWIEAYDKAEVTTASVPLGSTEWARCFSSNSPRALATARTVYPGFIMETPVLREPNLQCFSTGSLRLPHWGWRWVLRFAWMTSHRSQLQAKLAFMNNIQTFAREILPKEMSHTLVVSHAGVMIFLRKELLKQGFKGPSFGIPDHGKLYIFEKHGNL